MGGIGTVGELGFLALDGVDDEEMLAIAEDPIGERWAGICRFGWGIGGFGLGLALALVALA